MNENIPITFPGLGWSFSVHSVALSLGNLTIKWYGILIAAGLLLAILYAFRRCRDFKISADDLTDVIIISLICGVVGARLYYVVFFPGVNGVNPYWMNPSAILEIWNGGLGIYGGVIGALLAAFIACKVKKISFGAVFDMAGLGFAIGQAIGRWGKFFNREAYGAATKSWWRMAGVDPNNITTGYQPCFFFESVWLIIGFVLLHFYSKKLQRFKGEIFLLYIMWYGFERFFIEGLRTDSLMIGNFRISQLIAILSFIVALCIWIWMRLKIRDTVSNKMDYQPLYAEETKAVEKEHEQYQSNSQKEKTDSEKEQGSDSQNK